MVTQTARIRRLVLVRLNPGDDLLLALRQAVAESGIRHGIVLSGIGSLSRYRVHVVKTTNLPPGDVFFAEDGPFDILVLTGYILDGRVHAHLTVSNTEKAMGGHLEEGCRVLTFAVVTLAETDETTDLTGWDRVGPSGCREEPKEESLPRRAGRETSVRGRFSGCDVRPEGRCHEL